MQLPNKLAWPFFNSASPKDSLEYCIGKFICILPGTHMLPTYQANYPTYDNYFGGWLNLIDNHHTGKINFLDIGGNVGDTSLYVLSHIDAQVTIVEPSSYFLKYLKLNIANNKLEKSFSVHDLALVLDNQSGNEIVLFGNGSTASLDKERQSSTNLKEIVKAQTLDSFLSQFHDSFQLVKIDVDSNDLLFVMEMLERPEFRDTIYFFEFDVISQTDRVFSETFQAIKKIELRNYHCIVVDNHGRTLLFTSEIHQSLLSLTNWLRIQSEASNQHVHYFDLWIFPESKKEVYEKIMVLQGNLGHL